MMIEASILSAHKRIESYVHRTPIIESSLLNELLEQKFLFKLEALQKVGAFKARGAINTLLSLKEKDELPDEVVAFSSGNHAQGVAWAAKTLGIKATILMDKASSSLKKQATKFYGANLVITEDRNEAEARVQEYIDKGAYFIHPYANPYIIQGQATACYEALTDIKQNIDAIFIPVGGGGFASGTYLAAKELKSSAKIFGCEPLVANDAARSLRSEEIYRFSQSPNTIADGVKTLSIADITFNYLKEFDGILEIEEKDIIYWTQWLTHLLKVNIEPSSALAMASAYKWLKETKLKNQSILIMVSGGNISAEKHQQIWSENFLEDLPKL